MVLTATALLTLIHFFPSKSTAQAPKKTKIELLNADVSEFNESFNAKATRLIGNVRFKHESAFMNCDSAYLFRDENRLDAFGHIRITQGDSMTMTGGKLQYDGNTRIANVFENIVLSDRKMTLRTRKIEYNLSNSTAYYTDSANIVDGENTLTSKMGFYYSKTTDLYFKEDVLLINPRYTLECDTLRYNTTSRIAYFLGPTRLWTKSSKMYCEAGWYNTNRQNCLFTKNAQLENDGQVLRGDTVAYDQKKDIGKAFGNVSITDSSRQLIIRGDYAEHHQLTDSSWVTGAAEMINYQGGDSLFLHADTLLAIGKTTKQDSITISNRDVFAFHHVKIYKSDLQGTCDSLVYTATDSTIRFFRQPVLWSGHNQLTADSIWLVMGDSSIQRIHLKLNALIISQSDTLQTGILDSLRFNQITGKLMIGHFEGNELSRIDVTGNGQTIYYAKSSSNKDVAVNRADCSDLIIDINKNELKNITLLNDPDGTLYPMKEMRTNELRLKGFQWLENKRPKSRDDIFLK